MHLPNLFLKSSAKSTSSSKIKTLSKPSLKECSNIALWLRNAAISVAFKYVVELIPSVFVASQRLNVCPSFLAFAFVVDVIQMKTIKPSNTTILK
jgi:hypothetical protein